MLDFNLPNQKEDTAKTAVKKVPYKPQPVKQENKELSQSGCSEDSNKNFGKFMQKQLEKEEIQKIYQADPATIQKINSKPFGKKVGNPSSNTSFS